ncbi:hypothetical protein EC988_009040, partial [Linderina pennispora]
MSDLRGIQEIYGDGNMAMQSTASEITPYDDEKEDKKYPIDGENMDAHDPDLEHRQRELAELDAATKVNWEMIKRLTVCGVAFLNDAYDMFAINIVAMIMGFVYYHDATGSAKNTVPQKWDTLIKIAVQVGCLLGQLVMGRLGDKIGRTTVYAASLMIAIFTTIASAFSNSMVKGMNVFCVLFIWRVLLGFGI